jgi:catalase
MAEQNATLGTAPDAASARNTAQYTDQSVMTGARGEVHQTAGGDTPGLTTQRGTPVADDQNSLKIGARGPTALEGFFRFPRIQW